ncbi:MAG: leucine-rich repeat domain-containing protein [Candidatus Azobacteroides sp.]|nr:leucine-rich repeat domain-containing protein [Candidatus Azobacteroides sp.]
MYQSFSKTEAAADRSSVMESGNHSKNGASLKSLRLRLNFKNLRAAVVLLYFCVFTNSAMGQTWDISDNTGWGNNVTATLNLTSGTLTISGTGNMADFYDTDIWNYHAPWYNSRSSIRTVIIGDEVINIGGGTFEGCDDLQTITIPSSVSVIGNGAFNGCSNLTNVIFTDGQTTLTLGNQTGDSYPGSYAIFLNCPINDVYIGRNINYLTGWDNPTTFQNNGTLTTLTFGNSVTSIGNSTFSGCTALKTVTIGNNVTAINDNSFENCTGLQSLTLGSALTSIGNYSFYGCNALNVSLIIPQGVTTIGYEAFEGSGLTSVTIPNSVTSIGSEVFNNCNNLKTVTIEDGSTPLSLPEGSFYWYTFKDCPIQTLHLGRDLNPNDSPVSPFSGIISLSALTIGKEVTNIGRDYFSDCSGLTTITSQNPTPPTANYNCFSGVSKTTCTVYVPAGSKCDYKLASQWQDFANILDGSNEPCSNGINDVLTNQLSIFPNPTQNDLFINSDLQIEKVEIHSLTGTLLMQENNFTGKISVSRLPQGVYLLKVYTDKGVVAGKIVKE